MSRKSGNMESEGGRHENGHRVTGRVQKKTLRRLARKSGFVRRQGKLTAYEFVVLMTVGQLALKHPSLAAMVQAIEAKISREALHQRFTVQSVLFLRGCLDHVLRQKLASPKPLDAALLRPFRRVLIFDASSWDVDPKRGNQTRSGIQSSLARTGCQGRLGVGGFRLL